MNEFEEYLDHIKELDQLRIRNAHRQLYEVLFGKGTLKDLAELRNSTSDDAKLYIKDLLRDYDKVAFDIFLKAERADRVLRGVNNLYLSEYDIGIKTIKQNMKYYLEECKKNPLNYAENREVPF